MRVRISAAIITFNEERNIERCLKSLQGVADETLVVDSFSIDDTENICRRYDVRFVQNPFRGHIEQKNFALDLTRHEYVLSLDADEALSDELRESILLAKCSWSGDGYEMNRLTNYCGKWIRGCGWYPDRKLRLVKKSKARWGGRNPHDRLGLEEGCETATLKGDLLHYSFYSVDQHRKQIEYFTDIAAREMFENGRRASLATAFAHGAWRFMKGYFLNLGILDGSHGLTICRLSAYAVYSKYRKLMKLGSAGSIEPD